MHRFGDIVANAVWCKREQKATTGDCRCPIRCRGGLVRSVEVGASQKTSRSHSTITLNISIQWNLNEVCFVWETAITRVRYQTVDIFVSSWWNLGHSPFYFGKEPPIVSFPFNYVYDRTKYSSCFVWFVFLRHVPFIAIDDRTICSLSISGRAVPSRYNIRILSPLEDIHWNAIRRRMWWSKGDVRKSADADTASWYRNCIDLESPTNVWCVGLWDRPHRTVLFHSVVV